MIDIPNSIFPTNDDGQAVCGKCKQPLDACTCPSYDTSKPKAEQYTLKIRMDKKNRKGKKVMMIEGLPKDVAYCKALAKTFKSKAGCGGTSYLNEEGGVIEIQGKNKDLIKKILSQEGFIDILTI